MAITATLIKAVRRDGNYKLEVDYSDGTDTVRKTHNNCTAKTDKDLVRFIRAQARNLTDFKDSDFSMHVGKTINIDPEPTPDPVIPPTPTADELAKISWFEDWRTYTQMKLVVEASIVATDDSRFIAQKEKIKAGWLDSYLGDL